MSERPLAMPALAPALDGGQGSPAIDAVSGVAMLPQGSSRRAAVLLGLCLLCFCALSAACIVYGGLNEDEGWYLYAASLLRQGRLPYLDFSYTQGPLHFYVYGLLGLGFDWTLYRGRIVSALLGLAALVLATGAARRLGGRTAALVCAAGLATNAELVYLLSIPKTYALAGALCSAAVWVSTSRLRPVARAGLVSALLALATGARLAVAPAVLVLLVRLWLDEPARRRAFWTALGVAAAVGALLFGPYLVADPELTLYNLVGYHLTRYAASGGLLTILHDKAHVAIELLRDLGFLLLAAGAGLWPLRASAPTPYGDGSRGELAWLYATAAAIGLAHFVPGGSYAEYQTIIAPLLAILAGCAISSLRALPGIGSRVVPIAAALLLLNALAVLQRPWDTSGGRAPVEEVRALAARVALETPPGSRLLTFHTYLAVEAGREVPPGFEMSLFSYYPEWDAERCARYRVVNDERIADALASPLTSAVFLMDLDFRATARFSGISPERRAAIQARLREQLVPAYRLAEAVDAFGQFADAGQLYLRADGP